MSPELQIEIDKIKNHLGNALTALRDDVQMKIKDKANQTLIDDCEVKISDAINLIFKIK